MKVVYQFFKLIRFSNLLVMILTMCVFYGLLSNYHLTRQYAGAFNLKGVTDYAPTLFEKIGLTDSNFILLIVSVVLIAASGNIINDYFDLKADRVNKPDRLIIDKYIKRRWAIILNWTFSIIGFFISLYLSFTLNNWWIVIVSFGAINLLYFYSAIYKRKFLIGNILVAFLIAILPFYVFIYGANTEFGTNSPFGSNDAVFFSDNILTIIGYCAFAFLLNLIREIIKDLADIKGDLLLKSDTLPIRIGIGKTKTIIYILIGIALVSLSYYLINSTSSTVHSEQVLSISRGFIYLIMAVIVTLMISTIVFAIRNQRKYYLLSSNLIKVAMLFGVLSALFYI